MSNSLTLVQNNSTIASLPLSIIENFFNAHKLSESKHLLSEIREQLFNRNYARSADSIGHDNVVYFFEKLEELIDAAYLLNSK